MLHLLCDQLVMLQAGQVASAAAAVRGCSGDGAESLGGQGVLGARVPRRRRGGAGASLAAPSAPLPGPAAAAAAGICPLPAQVASPDRTREARVRAIHCLSLPRAIYNLVLPGQLIVVQGSD